MPSHKISLIIPTMNRAHTLARTLETYMQASVIPDQIVIVDQSENGETRASVREIAAQYAHRTEITYVYQETPSLTRARNRGIALAVHGILVFSDDDVEVYEDTLQKVRELLADESISMLAGLDDHGENTASRIGYVLGTRSFRHRRIGHVTASVLGRYPKEVRGQIETQWAMGYFFVVRKALLDTWGLRFDENLTSYGYAEDLDFTYGYYRHSIQNNLRCVLDESVHVRHRVSDEYRIPSRTSTYMYVINRAYIAHKHGMGTRAQIAMGWCNFWMTVMRIVKRENAADMLHAIRVARKNKAAVREGRLHTLYEK